MRFLHWQCQGAVTTASAGLQLVDDKCDTLSPLFITTAAGRERFNTMLEEAQQQAMGLQTQTQTQAQTQAQAQQAQAQQLVVYGKMGPHVYQETRFVFFEESGIANLVRRASDRKRGDGLMHVSDSIREYLEFNTMYRDIQWGKCSDIVALVSVTKEGAELRYSPDFSWRVKFYDREVRWQKIRYLAHGQLPSKTDVVLREGVTDLESQMQNMKLEKYPTNMMMRIIHGFPKAAIPMPAGISPLVPMNGLPFDSKDHFEE
jgi:hypothetical protein